MINPPKPKTAAKPAARGDVTVAVFNGSGKSGLAAQAASGLTKAGFKVGATGNADRQDYNRTEIRYGAGGEAGARAVLAVIPSAKLVQRDGVSGVQLVLGSDFSSIGATPPAGAGGDELAEGSGGLAHRRRHRLRQLKLGGGVAAPDCMIAAARSRSAWVTIAVPKTCTAW